MMQFIVYTALSYCSQVHDRISFTCIGQQYVVLLQRTLTSQYSTEAAAPPAKVWNTAVVWVEHCFNDSFFKTTYGTLSNVYSNNNNNNNNN